MKTAGPEPSAVYEMVAPSGTVTEGILESYTDMVECGLGVAHAGAATGMRFA